MKRNSMGFWPGCKRGEIWQTGEERRVKKEREMWESESWIREDYLLSYVTT